MAADEVRRRLGPQATGRAVGYSGVTVWSPEGKLLGRIRLPEVCGNVTFGGPKRNRLFMAASQSLYAVYTGHAGRRTGLALFLPHHVIPGSRSRARNDGGRIDSLKFVTNPQPAANRLGKSWAPLNPALWRASASSFSRKGRGLCTNARTQIFYRRRIDAARFPVYFRMLTLPTTRAICGLTDRCTAARFTRLAWRRPRRRRSVALPAMSRRPFASGKCLRCSPPMSGGATSAIHDTGVISGLRPAGTPDKQPSGNFTGL